MGKIIWVVINSIEGEPIYPVLLDIADIIRTYSKSEIVSSACAKIAPIYEDLVNFGLAGKTEMRLDYINQYAPSHEEYILWNFVQSLYSLKEFGIIFHHPERYDRVSKKFVNMLARTRQNHIHIAINGFSNKFRSQKYLEYKDNFKKTLNQISIPKIKDVSDPAIQFVALCPQGLPVSILQSLVADYDESLFCVYETPLGEKSFCLPPAVRYKVCQKNKNENRNLRIKLFDVWDPRGWGYLRRGGHAIIANDYKRILKQHLEYTHGMKTIGRDFLYFQFVTMSRQSTLNSQNMLSSLVSAARLAIRVKVRRRGGFNASFKYYERAIRNCTNSFVKSMLINEIALLYAYKRNHVSLKKARRWYDKAFSILPKVADEEKVSAEIYLCNGLALVEYRDRNISRALSLELHALQIASKHPQIASWALPLINSNIAEIALNRLQSKQTAIYYLKKNLKSELEYVQEYTRKYLAGIYFDMAKYEEVVKLLSVLFEQNKQVVVTKNDLNARVIYNLSLLAVGEIERAQNQVASIRQLCNIFSSTGGFSILEKICNEIDRWTICKM